MLDVFMPPALAYRSVRSSAMIGPLMHGSLDDLATGARLLWSLPGFLHHPITVEEARATLRKRLAQRETDFLALVRRAVYGNPASPYLELLHLVGCEYGDLAQLVGRAGLEGALHTLYRQGVYLTVEELKGRRPVIRGSSRLLVNAARLRNPSSALHTYTRSSGTRGPGTAVGLDLAVIRDEAINRALVLVAARDGRGWRHAHWGVPGGAAIGLLLELCALSAYPVRWFSQVDPAVARLPTRYRWSTRIVRWGARVAGVSLPYEQHVPVENPLPIADWMGQVLRAGSTPHLFTYASPAVRLCQAALEAGIGLDGAQFTLWGEPLTEARLAAIRRTGAEALAGYGSAESGVIAEACLARNGPDDLHLLHDRHALIQPGPSGGSSVIPAQGLLISSLRPTARLILLNVSLGDRARVQERACGCSLEQLGWTIHLQGVHSYEKLTVGGMTFLDMEVVRVLEEVLPARFGGGPLDYQLVEQEEPDGSPRLRLLVHPNLGPLESEAVADVFLRALGSGSGAKRVMEMQWREARWLQIERRAPYSTHTGKIMHLHHEARSAGVGV